MQINLLKITVFTLQEAINLLPDSIISSAGGELLLKENNDSVGCCKADFFGKTLLVDDRGTDSFLVIGEYCVNSAGQINKFKYGTRMEYVSKLISKVRKEWKLQE